ncbi:AAEL013435-PA [Aedes aegypti]|uniref:AAEL013435-PA n=1 Tax=Aedes aegypti TaxID=7159 RepID=Q16J58_AEDAE|nr:AAEL013435-PA [Aedes aegypti]
MANGTVIGHHRMKSPKIDRIESTLEYPIGSNVKNYPYELIDQLVAQQGYANLFDSYPEDEEVDDFTFHNRMSFSDDDFEDICESQKPDKYPQHGLTMDNKNVTIVNTKNFTQRVEMEVCRQVWKQGTPCVMCDNQFKKTECRQIFLELTLHAFDKSKNQIYKEKVMIPASCKCMVVRFKGF